METAFRRSSKALFRGRGRLICSSPAAHRPLGTLELAASVVARFIEPTAPESLDPSQSIEIIRFILGRIREEVPRGVKVVLAHQGTRDFLGPKLGLSSTIFCQFADVCIDLDDVAADPVHLLPDGHWSASGHLVVAQALLKALRD